MFVLIIENNNELRLQVEYCKDSKHVHKKKHILELCDNDTFMDTTTLMPMTESFQTCQNCLPHGVIDNMVP